MRKRWEVQQRFIAGVKELPKGRLPMFFTLTFPAHLAPAEDDAHRAWRSLVGRLRYRQMLGAYGWVLQRTKRGILHFHGIAHLPWFDDDLTLWRRLITESGFGVQNKLVVADSAHAAYCARYIGTGWAELARLRRAYGFSRDFPQTEYVKAKRRQQELLRGVKPLGVEPECEWVPEWELRG